MNRLLSPWPEDSGINLSFCLSSSPQDTVVWLLSSVTTVGGALLPTHLPSQIALNSGHCGTLRRRLPAVYYRSALALPKGGENGSKRALVKPVHPVPALGPDLLPAPTDLLQILT